MKRKFRLIIAACVLAFVALTGCSEKTAPTFPHTTDGDPTDAKYFNFDLNADETGYIISAKADADLPLYVILPATYEEKPVVAIKERGFAGGKFISVSIPAGVTETGIRAFCGLQISGDRSLRKRRRKKFGRRIRRHSDNSILRLFGLYQTRISYAYRGK